MHEEWNYTVIATINTTIFITLLYNHLNSTPECIAYGTAMSMCSDLLLVIYLMVSALKVSQGLYGHVLHVRLHLSLVTDLGNHDNYGLLFTLKLKIAIFLNFNHSSLTYYILSLIR